MDEALLPAPALVPDPEPVPDPALDVDPRLDPKPPKFGLVGTLQNVAVISCWQMMPVLGSSELFIVPPVPSACCCDCAATGEYAKRSAVISMNFFISLSSGLRGHARPRSTQRAAQQLVAFSTSTMETFHPLMLSR
jgi:hypothetical protein